MGSDTALSFCRTFASPSRGEDIRARLPHMTIAQSVAGTEQYAQMLGVHIARGRASASPLSRKAAREPEARLARCKLRHAVYGKITAAIERAWDVCLPCVRSDEAVKYRNFVHFCRYQEMIWATIMINEKLVSSPSIFGTSLTVTSFISFQSHGHTAGILAYS